MGTLRLSRRGVVDLVSVNFEAAFMDATSCVADNEVVVEHRIRIVNPMWGTKLKDVAVTYSADSERANLCRGRDASACQVNGGVVTAQVKNVGQAYWAGSDKVLSIRLCFPGRSEERSVTLFYVVTAAPYTRGSAEVEHERVTIEERLTVFVDDE